MAHEERPKRQNGETMKTTVEGFSLVLEEMINEAVKTEEGRGRGSGSGREREIEQSRRSAAS